MLINVNIFRNLCNSEMTCIFPPQSTLVLQWCHISAHASIMIMIMIITITTILRKSVESGPIYTITSSYVHILNVHCINVQLNCSTTHELCVRFASLQWRHNGCDGVSNHQPHDCLLNRYSCGDKRKHQSSASLAFVWGIHRSPVNSPHKWPVRRKMFPFDDVIMFDSILLWFGTSLFSHNFRVASFPLGQSSDSLIASEACLSTFLTFRGEPLVVGRFAAQRACKAEWCLCCEFITMTS